MARGGYPALSGAIVVALSIAGLCSAPSHTRAAQVGGILAGRDGKPEAGRQIHFEGRVTHEVFLTQTGADGGFSLSLPPGDYDLRAERGAPIASGIIVEEANVNLGKLTKPRRFFLMGLFDREGIEKGIVKSPAPSTANIPAVEGLRASANAVESPAASASAPSK